MNVKYKILHFIFIPLLTKKNKDIFLNKNNKIRLIEVNE